MPISTVIHTNDQSIDRVLKAGLPTVLVFWRRSSALPPALESQLDQLAQQYAGKALIAKVDADAERGIMQRFSVGATPALLLVSGDETVTTLTGEGMAQVGDWLAHLVAGAPRPAAPTPQPAAAAKPLVLTDANFQAVINGPLPVLVDFWAPWCGPCRMVAPHVERLAQEYAGRAVVGKLNTDENRTTAERYRIMSIPALYIFKGGKLVEEMIGAQPYQVLQQRLARQVG